MGNLARAGVFCLMGLAICLARLVEVELGPTPKATISAVEVTADPAKAQPISLPEAAPAPLQPAEPEAEPQPQVVPVTRSYVIQKGDTLGSISQKVYGTSKGWKTIHKANRALIPTPNRLKVGKTLVIPPR